MAFRARAALVAMLLAVSCVLGACASSTGSAASAPASSGASAAQQSQASASASQPASSASAVAPAATATLAPGEYEVKVATDSSMFHLNEASHGMGTLTVTDQGMTVHIALASKKIVNLFAGSAADAQAPGAQLIEPTNDQVTYDDGYEEEVYGFDVPVPVLDEPFDVAILGSKGTWYDHRVTVTSPEAAR